MRSTYRIASLLLLVPAIAAAQADPALFDLATGYRIAHYRGVVLSAPPGVRRIDDMQAATLHDSGAALFVDVTPAAGAHRDSAGAWLLAEPHDTIPGAHWFPEAGRGPADPAIDRWFAAGIKRLAHGGRGRMIVTFCLADCWMSWNAAYKLRRAGYRDVRWYANGADGWRELNRPLVSAVPER